MTLEVNRQKNAKHRARARSPMYDISGTAQARHKFVKSIDVCPSEYFTSIVDSFIALSHRIPSLSPSHSHAPSFPPRLSSPHFPARCERVWDSASERVACIIKRVRAKFLTRIPCTRTFFSHDVRPSRDSRASRQNCRGDFFIARVRERARARTA